MTVTSTILSVAAPAAGVCTRTELRAVGVPDRTISAQVTRGLLHRIGRGVYLVAELASATTPYFAAAKAHPNGVVSHRSAARLWDFPVGPVGSDEPVDLVVPRPFDGRPRTPGVTVHRVRTFDEDDVAEPLTGLRATDPTRTIVDLAGGPMSDARLRHVIQTQVVAGCTTIDAIAECRLRIGGPGVPGSGRLRRLLAGIAGPQGEPESVLERRVGRLLPPGFVAQFRPPWYDGVRGVVDFADRSSRVIVEADGRRWHTTGQAMAEDRRRDRIAAAAGWLVVRVTWDDVVRRPSTTAADIAAVVDVRRDRPA